MLFKIATVGESAAGKAFAKDILGRVFFPQTGVELVQGHYGFAVKTKQTMTKDEDGNLVNLPEPRDILQVTTTFPTKAEAINAAAEAGTLGAEVAAEVSKQAKELKLTDEQVLALSDKW